MTVRHQIPVLEKAIRVLGALAQGREGATAAALARELRIAPATAYRIIRTLSHAGWVDVADDGRCELGLGLLPMVRRLQDHDLLGARMAGILEHLSAATGLASKVSVRDGDEAVTAMRVNSTEPMALAVQPGSRFHLTLGSSGAVLLAAMEDEEVDRIIERAPAACWQYQKPADVRRRIAAARQEQVVVDAGQYRPDILGISVPLRHPQGQVQGTLTITGLLHGHSSSQIRRWRELLMEQGAQFDRRPQSSNGKPK